MNRLRTVVLAGALAASGAIAGVPGPAGAHPVTPTADRVVSTSCAHATAGHARCMSLFRQPGARAGARTAGTAAALPSGALSPAQITAAYHLGSAPRPHTVVAVVDAYGYPKAESDLAVYRSRFGLPACTTANKCFRKVNQHGKRSPLPTPDPGWGLETALDLDAVSAACPTCSILLVEGDSDAFTALAAAENTAVRLGAKVVSNSYGAQEAALPPNLVSAYTGHAGVSVVASSGDGGFGPANMPAAYRNVIAVGGTSLLSAPGTSRGWHEQAWSGAGSGCSAYIAKPSWQHDANCPMRTVADVSAVADPATNGLYIYDTYQLGSVGLQNGWVIGGGTSQSAPLVAAMIARSGRILSDASYLYAHTSALYDPVGGSNGYCGNDYLCTGKRGYDAPTGAGSPDGVGAL